MKKKLRIGAIGCGYWGPNLIRNFVEIPDAEMVAVADLNRKQLDRMTTRHPHIVSAVQDYRELFEMNLDAVVVATPPRTHHDIVSNCLRNGLHVLVEKPLTLESREAEDLIGLARAKQRVLMVGHTFQYHPAVDALRDLIASGELGEVHYIDAVRASLGLFHRDLNVIWDLAPHDISILVHLLGALPLSISAHGRACVQDSIEDVAYISATFPNDVLAHIRLSWLDPCKIRRLTVVGSEKMAVYDDVESLEKIRVYNKRVQASRRTDTFGEFQFAYHYGDVVSPYVRMEEPLRVECLHFLRCIREGKTPLTDGACGLAIVRTIEAAQHSLSNGGQQVPLGIPGRPAEKVEMRRGSRRGVIPRARPNRVDEHA